MSTILSIPEVEFMLEEVRCAPGEQGGTTMTITWRVAGVSKAGNDAVQTFFDSHWDWRMGSIERTYAEKLAKAGS
jgi:hypothetical protein